ncbi:MAG: hypothetical protein V2I33_18405 [Kangiellaceae bacterium]|nr:hypothetical protein [Kangiellaceae bacterium]
MTKPIGRHLVKGAKPTSEREKEKSPPARARARTLPTAPKGLTKNIKPTSNLQMKLLSVAP